MKTEYIFTIDSDNQEMFEVFCKLHPHEAFDLNPKKFCEFMRKQGFNISDEGIIQLINETK